MVARPEFRTTSVADSATEMYVETDPTGRFTRSNEVLGQGASKTVYKGFDRIEGIEVAWNQASMSGGVEAALELLHTEVAVLKKLKHRNIMNFHVSWVDNEQGTLNFITEYFHTGCLKRHRMSHKFISPQLLKRWAWQILQGLVYLHGHNPPIIHRDLKCDNIFIHGVTGEVKIGDLGLARLMEENLAMCHTCLGTPEFMAPEMYNEQYNEKVDIYSYGMCLLEMVTMSYPYSECKSACQIYRNVTQGIQPKALDRVSDLETRHFIELCINHDHERRPSARQLVKHKFFSSLQFRQSQPQEGCAPTKTRKRSLDDDRPVEISLPPKMATLKEEPTLAEALGLNLSAVPAPVGQDEDNLSGLRRLMGEGTSDEESCRGPASPSASVVDSISEWEDLTADASKIQHRTNFFVQHRDVPSVPFSDVVYFDLEVGGLKGPKRLMFSFDMETDTVEDVGLELMEEFSLSPEEREQFTDVLRQELERVSRGSSTDDAKAYDSFLGSTFGSIIVSMSLEDWTSGKQTDTAAAKKEIAYKMKREKARNRQSMELVTDDSVSKPYEYQYASSRSSRKSFERSSHKSFDRSSRKSFERSSHKSFDRSSRKSFDRSSRRSAELSTTNSTRMGSDAGSAWSKLLAHMQKGTKELHRPSMKSGKKANSGGEVRFVEQDSDGMCRTDTAHVQFRSVNTNDENPEGVGGPTGRSLSTLSADNVLGNARRVARVMRHLQAAAMMLYRNSLESKKSRMEAQLRGLKSTKSRKGLLGKTKSLKSFIFAQTKSPTPTLPETAPKPPLPTSTDRSLSPDAKALNRAHSKRGLLGRVKSLKSYPVDVSKPDSPTGACSPTTSDRSLSPDSKAKSLKRAGSKRGLLGRAKSLKSFPLRMAKPASPEQPSTPSSPGTSALGERSLSTGLRPKTLKRSNSKRRFLSKAKSLKSFGMAQSKPVSPTLPETPTDVDSPTMAGAPAGTEVGTASDITFGPIAAEEVFRTLSDPSISMERRRSKWGPLRRVAMWPIRKRSPTAAA